MTKNKALMEKFVTFINTKDYNLGKEILDENVTFFAPTHPEPLHGFDGYKQILEMMHGAMPDVKWTAEEMIEEGNKVMVRFTMTGTNTGSFMGIPPTGKSVSVTAMNIYELKDGKIVREHGLPDLFNMMAQLGLIPKP